MFCKKGEVSLSPSKTADFPGFDEKPLEIMKNHFYFILKALSVLKILKFLFDFLDYT